LSRRRGFGAGVRVHVGRLDPRTWESAVRVRESGLLEGQDAVRSDSCRTPRLLPEGTPTPPLISYLPQVLTYELLELSDPNNQAKVFDPVFVEPLEDGVQRGEQQD
jgi:hypothetical protein